MKFEINKEYTAIGISSMFAFTCKTEIKVKELKDNGDPIFILKGKRKLKVFNDDWRTRTIVFEGWNIPLKIDSEQTPTDNGNGIVSKMTAGNACFNFMGTKEFVREFIEKNNLNEYFNEFDCILAHGDKVTEHTGTPVFPETPTTHAVVLRIRKEQGLDKIAPEVVSSYSRSEAIEDGVLMPNPRKDKFSECDIITCNLCDKLNEIVENRNKTRTVFETDFNETVAALMANAKEIYDNKRFEGDNDKDFFVLPKTKEGTIVWFVRNENGMLTAMLPEDY